MVNCKLLKSVGVGAAAVAMALSMNVALAGVSQQDAAKLGNSLTPFGGIKAGSKDGKIPAWTGGYTKVPAGYKKGDLVVPEFLNKEKPVVKITGENYEKYKDHLTNGEIALLKKYPGFYMLVYPTHRTAAAPDWVNANTRQNAENCKLINNGNGIDGCYGGLPFPIPKNGAELEWNQRIPWVGQSFIEPFTAYIFTSNGKREFVNAGFVRNRYPYYIKGNREKWMKGPRRFQLGWEHTTEPPSANGQALLLYHYTRNNNNIKGWQYLVGQHRMRQAPRVVYDVPDFVVSGVNFFDEAFVHWGPFGRYNWKIVGEKELYIPYNENLVPTHPIKDLMPDGMHYLNPKYIRFELHRVWVVKGTLKPGEREVEKTRIDYFDEDTGETVWCDNYDSQGKLWHITWALPFVMPDIPAVVNNAQWGTYNIQTGEVRYTGSHYMVRKTANLYVPQNNQEIYQFSHEPAKPFPESMFNPFHVAAASAQ